MLGWESYDGVTDCKYNEFRKCHECRDLQQLALVVFSFLQLAQTLYLHLGWLLSATCTGGLVHRSTGAYTACTDCNLHCVVVVVMVLVVYI